MKNNCDSFASQNNLTVKRSGKSTYILPQSFIKEMNMLEKLLNDPVKTDTKYIKPSVDTRNKSANKQWIKEKTDVILFKATVIDLKEGLEKDINDIRKALNMISKKNFDSQKKIILKFLREFVNDDEALTKISDFIFDIASSNMFYGDIYADLYVDFAEETIIFKKTFAKSPRCFQKHN